MTQPVTYVEINSPDVERSAAFFAAVFGWQFQPFAAPDYLVAAGATGGVDTGLMPSRDGAPRTIPVIRVASVDRAAEAAVDQGGSVAVPAFTIAGVGRGCYVSDPTGVLIGLHEYDPQA
jgi:predicted enzyme related to lactoylglutathione lyase